MYIFQVRAGRRTESNCHGRGKLYLRWPSAPPTGRLLDLRRFRESKLPSTAKQAFSLKDQSILPKILPMHFQISSLSLKIEYNHIMNKLSSVAGDLRWNPIGASLYDLPPMFESFQPEWTFGERSQIACGEDKIRYDWNNLG